MSGSGGVDVPIEIGKKDESAEVVNSTNID